MFIFAHSLFSKILTYETKAYYLNFYPITPVGLLSDWAEPDMRFEGEDVSVSGRFLSPEEAGMMAGDFMASLHGEDSATRGKAVLGFSSKNQLIIDIRK